jgi:hypothetical protein
VSGRYWARKISRTKPNQTIAHSLQHSYLLIQIPAFVYAAKDDSTAELAHDEKPWAMFGLVSSLLSFALYLIYQFRHAASDEVKNDKIAEIALKK